MRKIKGFTLIEMVMVIVLLGIVISMASLIMKAGFDSYFTGESVTALANEASIAMTRMNKELERATGFTVMDATTVTFVMSNGVSVNYSLSGTNLYRNTSVQSLSQHVTAFSLKYYDDKYAEITLPVSSATVRASARALTISMTVSDGNETIPLISTVYLRNM